MNWTANAAADRSHRGPYRIGPAMDGDGVIQLIILRNQPG
jgi:hypothetical protein